MNIKLEITDIGCECEYERSEDIKCCIDDLLKLTDEMILYKKVYEFWDLYKEELKDTEVKAIKRFLNIVKFYGDFTNEEMCEAYKE